MKAQNLTISVPDKGCDKNCPYCISQITWAPRVDDKMMVRNGDKVLKLADSANVTNILITGKGEPFLNWERVGYWAMKFRHFPVEVQTNGKSLMQQYKAEGDARLIRNLKMVDLDVIAFSIDGLEQLKEYEPLFACIADHGMIVRVCVNLTAKIEYDLNTIIDAINKVGNVRQALFRNITYPSLGKFSPTGKGLPGAVQWIDENTDQGAYLKMAKGFHDRMSGMMQSPIRVLPETGVEVYDVMGISVCFSDYCIQQGNQMEDIRSLIFHQDGHVYTSWDTPASILF